MVWATLANRKRQDISLPHHRLCLSPVHTGDAEFGDYSRQCGQGFIHSSNDKNALILSLIPWPYLLTVPRLCGL